MAFKEVTGNVDMWNGKDAVSKGDAIEGRVTALREARNEKSSRVAIIELEDGTSKGVWLSTKLDGVFAESVKVGDMVRITYKGMAKAEKGGNDYHDFTVEVDAEA